MLWEATPILIYKGISFTLQQLLATYRVSVKHWLLKLEITLLFLAVLGKYQQNTT